jgi:hypothetical protein
LKFIRVSHSASRPCRPCGLDLEPVDEIEHLEVATGTGSDAAPDDCHGQMGVAGAGAADQDDALGDEAAATELIDQRPVDRRPSRTGSP